jgi:hypothetical protein
VRVSWPVVDHQHFRRSAPYDSLITPPRCAPASSLELGRNPGLLEHIARTETALQYDRDRRGTVLANCRDRLAQAFRIEFCSHCTPAGGDHDARPSALGHRVAGPE